MTIRVTYKGPFGRVIQSVDKQGAVAALSFIRQLPARDRVIAVEEVTPLELVEDANGMRLLRKVE